MAFRAAFTLLLPFGIFALFVPGSMPKVLLTTPSLYPSLLPSLALPKPARIKPLLLPLVASVGNTTTPVKLSPQVGLRQNLQAIQNPKAMLVVQCNSPALLL